MTQACRDCRHFEGSALGLEAALPAMATLSSAHAASRSDDGLCSLHDRHVRALARCPSHAPPGQARPLY